MRGNAIRNDNHSSARRREQRRGRGVGAVLAAVFALSVLGAAPAGAQDADDPADLMQGMEIFNAGCNSCHQTDGSGSAVGRSLIGIAIEQPDRLVHIESVTNGIGRMPGYADRLTADEIDAAVTYLRLTFVSDDGGIDELPNTGSEGWILALGVWLVVLGTTMVAAPAVRAATVRSTH